MSTTLDDGSWVVELRRPDNSGPGLGVEPGTALALPGGVRLILLRSQPDPAGPCRLWRSAADPGLPTGYLGRHGRPIRYGHVAGAFPLAEYQNVHADRAADGGSAEMASAGRPFTADLLVRLIVRGIAVAPLTLHTGVSGPEAHEPPYAEWFSVPAATAGLVAVTRQAGRRVVAVGTTVTRALESATGEDGVSRPASGWTDLVLGPDRPVRAVNGPITGLHTPQASHLLLLEAVAGPGVGRLCRGGGRAVPVARVR